MRTAFRRALVALVGTALALTSLIASPQSASADSAPYSPCYAKYNQTCIDDEFGYTGQRPWGYPVDNWGNNCTNYASFRLNKDGVPNPGNLGNAADWAANARAKGITVDGTPAVGSIAQWVSGNHVAYVDWVSADGNQIAVSESGYDGPQAGIPNGPPSMSGRSIINRNSTRVGSSPSYKWPDNFIRFRSGSFASAPNPTVSGTAMVGMTLAASTGAWNPTPNFSYQWSRNGAAIGGATGDAYVVQSDDLGTNLTVTVTGSRAGYTTTSRTSAPTDVVLGIDANGNGIDDTQDLLPWNSDVNSDGRGDVVGFANAGVSVALNTGTSFAPSKLWIKDFGYNAQAGGWQTANHPRAVSLVRVNGPTPKISGKAKAKSKLTAKPGTWKPGRVTLKYQWYRNSTAIKGATKSTYKLATADKGKKVKVIVTGRKAGYASVAKSSATKKIAK